MIGMWALIHTLPLLTVLATVGVVFQGIQTVLTLLDHLKRR